MGKMQTMINGISAYIDDVGRYAIDALEPYSELIVEGVIENLMQGIDGNGEPLRPTYAEDTFFKSAESMQRYVQRKIESGVGVPSNGSPNLTINGRFHSSLTAVRYGNEIEVMSDTSISRDGDVIRETWKTKSFAPSDEWFEQVREDVKQRMIAELQKALTS